ncbi:hypothetical protein SAMN05216482_1765 [Streptomyces sp. PAN_FS17]|nr:hypothetical protein SAMN05216482_1765 [Streptomyces sp. PAN_FS17]
MTVTTGGPRTEAAEQPRREGVAPAGGSPGPRLRGGTQPNGPGQPLRARTVAVRAALRRRHRVTVPARLRLLRTATVLLATASAALLLVAGITALGTWDTVADRDAPRTTSAAGLALALNDMDAQAANILLSSGDAGRGRLGTPYRKAVGLYGDARRGIGHELRTLAVAAQGNPADEKTVESLTDGFAEYQELVGRALENDGRKGGKPDALDDHREATDLLQHRLLPEARTLVSSNDDAFEAHYNSARTTLTVQFTAVVALGVLLLAVLGFLQWYLARRFRRILNPGVLAATACALLAVILGGQMLSASSDQLRGARRDAFDSVVALSRARAIAYDANADESRYLLDPGRRDQYERAFLAKSQELYGIEGATLSSYDAGLAVASLKRLSAWTSTWTLGGSASRLPSAVTATGSVLASTDPSTRAICQDSGVTADATAPTAAADASTRPTASTPTGFHTSRSSRQDSSSALAYRSGGRTTRPMISGLISICGVPGSSATARPATTSREGAGMRHRRAKVATTVASTTSARTVPTLRMPKTPPGGPVRSHHGFEPTRLPGTPPSPYPAPPCQDSVNVQVGGA